jgi:hypothetical protein
MPTLKQIAANRINAQKSTGPRTPEGKSTSRLNALKSGIDAHSTIIRGEAAADLEALTVEYLARFNPATPEERFYVDILIRDDWQRRRLAQVESQVWEHKIQDIYKEQEGCVLGQAFVLGSDVFARLQRRIEATERSYRQALKELQQLRAAEPTSEPSQPSDSEPTSPEIGFVPESPLACASACRDGLQSAVSPTSESPENLADPLRC